MNCNFLTIALLLSFLCLCHSLEIESDHDQPEEILSPGFEEKSSLRTRRHRRRIHVVHVNGISENVKKNDSENMEAVDVVGMVWYAHPIVGAKPSSPEGSDNHEVYQDLHHRRTRFNEDVTDNLHAMEEDIEVRQYFAADQMSSSLSYIHQVDGRFESHPRPKGRSSGNQRDGNENTGRGSKSSKSCKNKDSGKNGKGKHGKTRKRNNGMEGLDVTAKEVHLVQRRYGTKLL